MDLELLPAYMSAPEAMDPDAIEIHPGTPNVYYETNCIKGEDTAPIMETAPNVVEIDSYCSRPVSYTHLNYAQRPSGGL